MNVQIIKSLNPFRTGRGLSTGDYNEEGWSYVVLIPFVQGGVFRPLELACILGVTFSLNPFHTGRGLSTEESAVCGIEIEGLNPFHTGRGLSTF